MAPSYRVRQKIRKGPPRLLRALVAPRSGRDAAVAAWAEEELEESERAEAQRWIRDNRESLLAGALEELIGLRERCAQRDEAAEAAVKRLNSVYEECMKASRVPFDGPPPPPPPATTL